MREKWTAVILLIFTFFNFLLGIDKTNPILYYDTFLQI